MAVCRILLVEDDLDILDLVDHFLRSEGYATLRATNGEQALHLVAQTPPDLILLDQGLPGISGRDVALALRARGIGAPIVAFTAGTYSGSWAPDIDVTSYLAKPFELDDLLAIVERYCPPVLAGAAP